MFKKMKLLKSTNLWMDTCKNGLMGKTLEFLQVFPIAYYQTCFESPSFENKPR